MSTNANVFNSRVTSEALEAKFRQVFPAQAGAELIQDLYASGVIQPVIDFSSVAEGSVLSQNLQTAWDLSTGNFSLEAGSSVIISNTGFWQIDVNAAGDPAASNRYVLLSLSDGITSKDVYKFELPQANLDTVAAVDRQALVVFVNTGQTVTAVSSDQDIRISGVYRQIADLYGNLVNPLGFTFS